MRIKIYIKTNYRKYISFSIFININKLNTNKYKYKYNNRKLCVCIIQNHYFEFRFDLHSVYKMYVNVYKRM